MRRWVSGCSPEKEPQFKPRCALGPLHVEMGGKDSECVLSTGSCHRAGSARSATLDGAPRQVGGAQLVLGLGTVWLYMFLINPIYFKPIPDKFYLLKGREWGLFLLQEIQNASLILVGLSLPASCADVLFFGVWEGVSSRFAQAKDRLHSFMLY